VCVCINSLNSYGAYICHFISRYVKDTAGNGQCQEINLEESKNAALTGRRRRRTNSKSDDLRDSNFDDDLKELREVAKFDIGGKGTTAVNYLKDLALATAKLNVTAPRHSKPAQGGHAVLSLKKVF
jgi:hypothetical protein